MSGASCLMMPSSTGQAASGFLTRSLMQLSHAFQPSTTVRHWSPALICSVMIATSGRASLGGSDDRGGTGGAAGHPTISTAGGVGRSTASNCGTKILPTLLQPVVSVRKRARHDVVLIERRTVGPPVLIGGGDALIFQRSRDSGGDLLGAEVLALENVERFLALFGGVGRDGGVPVRQVGARIGGVPLEVKESDHPNDGGRTKELGQEGVQPTTP